MQRNDANRIGAAEGSGGYDLAGERASATNESLRMFLRSSQADLESTLQGKSSRIISSYCQVCTLGEYAGVFFDKDLGSKLGEDCDSTAAFSQP